MTDQIIFGAVAKDYAALGLRVVPTGGPDGKKPLIAHWPKVRPQTAVALADKFATANIGLIGGDPNGITLIDIDDRSLVDDCVQRFGSTPVMVSTPSGGFHLWYRANGERRIIRLEGEKIDILGKGGLGIAPPSVNPKKGPYFFEEGGLDNFERLPIIRPGSLPPDAYTLNQSRASPADSSALGSVIDDGKIRKGQRNKWLFRQGLQAARGSGDLDQVIDALREENKHCSPPLSDAQVIKIANSAWNIERDGNNWIGKEHRALIVESEFNRLSGEADAVFLLIQLWLAHASRIGDFVLANALAKKFGWGLPRFRKAKSVLRENGIIKCTRWGGDGPRDPPRYQLHLR